MRRRALLVVLLTGIAAAAAAQAAGAEITGVITDQAHTPVPGATVTATNAATNQARVAVTTSDGLYTLSGLAPGEYRVDVALRDLGLALSALALGRLAADLPGD